MNIEKCLELHSQGLSLRVIAGRLHCSVYSVMGAVHKAGMECRSRPYRRNGRFPKPNSKSYWERIMRRWLGEFGIYRCTLCDTWKAGVDSSNKHCGPCHRGYAPKYESPEAQDSDWGPKANAYFEKQVALAPHYYTGTRPPLNSTPLSGAI